MFVDLLIYSFIYVLFVYVCIRCISQARCPATSSPSSSRTTARARSPSAATSRRAEGGMNDTAGNPRRAFRYYPLIEIRQTVPCRAMRGKSLSVNSTLPPSLLGEHRLGHRLGQRRARVVLAGCRRGHHLQRQGHRPLRRRLPGGPPQTPASVCLCC